MTEGTMEGVRVTEEKEGHGAGREEKEGSERKTEERGMGSSWNKEEPEGSR